MRKKWLKPVGSVILAMGGVIWLLPLLKGFNIDVDRLLAILPGQNSYIPCLLLLYCVQSLSPIAFLPYNVLVVVTSMLLPLPLALAISFSLRNSILSTFWFSMKLVSLLLTISTVLSI